MGERGRACACVPRVCHPCAPAALSTHGTSSSHDFTRGGHGASHATRAWQTTRAGPSGSVKAREHEDRDLPAGLVLILDKNGHLGGLAVEQALALLPRGHGGLDPQALGAHFDRRLRVRAEVVVPGRVLGGTANEAITTRRSPSVVYTKGVVIVRPLRAPVIVKSSTGIWASCPPTFP